MLDTGVFSDSEYTDVLVEYAKGTPTDILIRISLTNRGAGQKEVHVLPTLWFRNEWSWESGSPKPSLTKGNSADPLAALVEATHEKLGIMALYCELPKELLFVENETNIERLYGVPNLSRFPKDGINDYLIHRRQTVNPEQTGTKAAPHYQFTLNAGETKVIKLRLTTELSLDPACGSDHLSDRRLQLDGVI